MRNSILELISSTYRKESELKTQKFFSLAKWSKVNEILNINNLEHDL